MLLRSGFEWRKVEIGSSHRAMFNKAKRALSATKRYEPVPTKQLKLLDLDDDSHDEDTNEAIQEDVPATVEDGAVVLPQIYKNRRFNSFF